MDEFIKELYGDVRVYTESEVAVMAAEAFEAGEDEGYLNGAHDGFVDGYGEGQAVGYCEGYDDSQRELSAFVAGGV